jgi:5-methylcytosine-specific restriction protein B
MAKRIVGEQGQVFFTQFHAETSYSDFVYGIVPDIHAADLKYSEREGIFVKAIKAALNSNEKKVFLIIDEINRANLSNVLGPAFYLFEPTMSSSNIKIEINPGLSLEKLPDNLYVIATMNTADRSLAVVDFALRRRFAWYTLYPHVIKTDSGKVFRDKEFNEIAAIFERYATDEELNLQPGHAYFIVSDKNPDDEIKTRLKYEIMPLIKEYLIDGMLLRAKDDFVNYFREEIGEEMYR